MSIQSYCQSTGKTKPVQSRGLFNVVRTDHGNYDRRLLGQNVSEEAANWYLDYYIHEYPNYSFDIIHSMEVIP